MSDKLAPIHPGEILKEEFMVPLNLSANQLAISLRVSTNRITQIVNGQRSITAETALRLSRYFGNSVGFWMGLQSQYDLEVAQDLYYEDIVQEVKPREAS